MRSPAGGTLGTRVPGHVLEARVLTTAPAAGVLGLDAAAIWRMDRKRFRSVWAGVACKVFQGCVSCAAVLANVLIRLFPFKEDVLALPAGPMWAAIAKKRLGVRVFLSAALAIGGRSLLRGIRRRSRWRR